MDRASKGSDREVSIESEQGSDSSKSSSKSESGGWVKVTSRRKKRNERNKSHVTNYYGCTITRNEGKGDNIMHGSQYTSERDSSFNNDFFRRDAYSMRTPSYNERMRIRTT